MITKNRVKDVCETLAMLIISASICWFIPFAVLASPNSVGALSEPQKITAVFDEHTASRLPTFSYDDVTQGMLVYQTANGNLMPSLPVDTQVSMRVSGLSNRVNVKQVFSNHTGFVLNGRYLFPLPNEAAVDSLRLHIGERIIEGQIHPKQEAQQIFEQAKVEGKRASLVSQERPNMFTTEVANLAPNEKLVVEISYQETIKYEDGLFSLRFPLVVAPRYIPGLTLGGESGQTGRVTSSQVFDADRIIAPIRGAPSEEEPVLKADIKVNLGLGVDKAAILSPYHAITLDEQQGGLTASLANRVRAERDFVLQWRLEQGVSPVAWVFNQNGKTHQTQAASDDGSMVNTAANISVSNIDNYSLVMVLPPKVEASGQLNLPRELILVIDTSGSMEGDSIIQAKNALRYALRGLKAQDSFNIIEFNSDVSLLSPVPLPATEENLAIARQFVNRLQADGGTEMALALEAALPKQRPNRAASKNNVLQQVIFMTDGSVGNEEALFELIRHQIGDNRLFTVGIGSAPNSHFMQRAAELGRGTFTYIGDVDEVEQKISQLLGKIQYPVLTDLQVRFDDGTVPDYWPAPIPDLYRGEPVLISLKRHPLEPQELVISGRQGHKNWQQSVSLESTERSNSGAAVEPQAAGLDLLWARKQIAALELSKNGANDGKVKQQVTALSMNYHLVSPYTSLVAVDLTPITTNAISRDAVVRQHLPLGWQPMGVLPQTSTSSRFDMLLGGGVLMIALMLALFIRRQQRQQHLMMQALSH